MRIPTIAIVNNDSKSGFSFINESDFDSKTHKKYKGDIPDPSAYQKSPFAGKTLKELRDLAKGTVEGKVAAMKKGDLIEALESLAAAKEVADEE